MAAVPEPPRGAPERSDERLAERVRHRLGRLEGEAFLARLDQAGDNLLSALTGVYGDAAGSLLGVLTDDLLDAAAARPEDLRVLDRRREIDPAWFLAQDMVGYVCYADRFAGTLADVVARLDHLDELGVRYLHLMPLLRPREGENDGGYAIADYDEVDPRLGTMADLELLAGAAHRRGIALCVDLVLNHTAREHAWAQQALAGDPTYRAYYRFFPDRGLPDAFEQTMPEVFPAMAPGSFSRVAETGEWVWTTFREFQWDLDWSNPAVFREMLGVMLRLANRGVDVLRLDAAPFLWKRLGTDCQNQPEAHLLLQALRALTRVAAPGLVLKAEAIVGPDQLVSYLGVHEVFRPECDLAYDNQLMVMLWSALATRDVRLAVHALTRRPSPPVSAGWVSYVRCHDDIGWAVSDEDARAVGLDPFSHRQFLASFYAGTFPGSFARGADFQRNPETGDVRTSGAAASLAGLEAALEAGDGAEVDAALRRLELLYAVVYSFGGIPLVYMGDELAQLNDAGWADEPGHADDNRWLHRPRMDWDAAARRHDPATVEGRMFTALRRLAQARRETEALRSDAVTEVLPLEDAHLLAYRRTHPRARPVLVVANFCDEPVAVSPDALARAGLGGRPVALAGDIDLAALRLPAWGWAWLTDPR